MNGFSIPISGFNSSCDVDIGRKNGLVPSRADARKHAKDQQQAGSEDDDTKPAADPVTVEMKDPQPTGTTTTTNAANPAVGSSAGTEASMEVEEEEKGEDLKGKLDQLRQKRKQLQARLKRLEDEEASVCRDLEELEAEESTMRASKKMKTSHAEEASDMVGACLHPASVLARSSHDTRLTYRSVFLASWSGGLAGQADPGQRGG